MYYASKFCLSNYGGICLIISVYDASNVTSANSAGWIQVKSIVISSPDFLQLMIICKQIEEIIWQLTVYIYIPKLQALNLKYILYFQQIQLFEKRLRVYIIQAVYKIRKTRFSSFDMPQFAIPNWRWERINETHISFIAKRGMYRVSLYIMSSVRDILLAFFCMNSNSCVHLLLIPEN